ncbi:hypothetical protein [Streptomyces coelicoflavus]|uniref:Uncharacterized protein n=1 Tax=Streptomyces coelicoflavus TaxID=285562 RepID=A0A6N9UPI1_9ACTN|nr:hypothetical protein [Streptomyces coelicoflavus]NEB19474.1 hypothetical protein [Streptomyces coelicoflavus]
MRTTRPRATWTETKLLTSYFSGTHWWIAAVLAGIAAALAFQSLIWEKKNRWKALLLPLGSAAGIAAGSMARDVEGTTPLALYTLAMLGLALTRVVFAGYIKRQTELVRSGQPVQQPTARQIALFVLTLMAIMLVIAVTL